MQRAGSLRPRRDLHSDANRRAPTLQEQQQQTVRKIAYWLVAAFCIGSALLVSIYVSEQSADRFSEDSLPGWRASANLALAEEKSAVLAPPQERHQPAHLIKSIESRLRDSVAGDLQLVSPQTEGANQDSGDVAASAGLDGLEEGFVSVGKVLDKKDTESSPSGSNSTVGSTIVQHLAAREHSVDRSGSPASLLDNALSGSWSAGSRKMQEQEVVVVLSVDDERQHQLEDTAALWQETRLYVVSNSSSRVSKTSLAVEKWAVYEDDDPLRSWGPAASRRALAAFLAYRDLGETFRWAFLGTSNTDTAIFVDAAHNLVKGLDADMPYFLTDNMWFGDGVFSAAYHPNPSAPSCVPCNYSRDTSELAVVRPVGCPCCPEQLCQADKDQKIFPNASQYCGIPRAPSRTYSYSGDGGAMMSIRLLRSIPFADMEECVLKQWNSAGDAMLTACLWKFGFAPTSPDPLWHPDGLSLFDASSALLPDPVSKRSIPIKVSRHLGNLLASLAGFCNALCKLEIDNVVSLHLAGGLLGTANVSIDAGQLIGLLRTAFEAGPGNVSSSPAEAMERLDRQLRERTAGARKAAIAELVQAGHVSAALQALRLLKQSSTQDAAIEALTESLLASSTTSGSAGAPTQRPSFTLAERVLVGATEGIAWELLWTLTSIKQAQGKPQSLTDMVNEALPGVQKGSVRKGLSLKGVSALQEATGLPEAILVAPAGDDLGPQDFAIAIVTHKDREHMLTSSRLSRQGVQTFFTTNHEGDRPANSSIYREFWGFYPDAKPIRSFYEGDARAAIAPFQAFKHLGDTFKWLFYSDDDTVFSLDATRKVVKGLDPDMPYFLTDNMWYSEHMAKASSHPNQASPQCVPCNYSKDTSKLPWPLPRGCPCKPEDLCKADAVGTLNKHSRPCGMPRVPARTYSMHGGAGALISIGLFRQVPYEDMHKCIQQAYSSGGDGFITECLWEAGFGMTNPDPLYHPRNLTMFDPSPPGPHPDDDILPKAAHTLGNLLAAAAGICHGICKLEVDHTVSLHLRSRRVGSDEAVYSTIDLLSTLLARLGGRSEDIFEGASPGRRMRHAVIQEALDTAIGVLQSSPMAHLKLLEQQSQNVQRMLHSASTGAAKVVARKLLDTLKREAVAFEESQSALKGSPGPAPAASAVIRGLSTNATVSTSDNTIVT